MQQFRISKSDAIIDNETGQLFMGSVATYMLGMYEHAINEVEIDVWLYAFQGRKISDVMQALRKHASVPKQGRFLPKPCDILDILEQETPSNPAGINGAYLPATVAGWA